MNRLEVPVGDGSRLSVVWSNPGGRATPVLLVHGLASNARLWDGVACRLAHAGHPVAAVDQRGHGLSSKPGHGYDFETLAADLMTVIAALGWKRSPPVVAGQSWGGNVVLHLAARYPSAVRGLVLVDGGTIELCSRFPDWDAAAAALAPPALAGTPAADLERTLRRSHPDWPETGIAGTMANMEVLEDGTIRPWLSRENHMRILRSLWGHRPSLLYASVTAPVVLVMACGGLAQPAEVSGAAGTLPSADVHWVDGDHDLHAQQPELVASLIEGLC